MALVRPRSAPDPAAVLTKAFFRAAERLDLNRRAMSRMVGVSEATLSRSGDKRRIDPGSKEGELALLFVRLYRSLDALVGGDLLQAKQWFHADNLHLSGVPAELVERAQGLVGVIEYLDAMRGKI
ncbi:MAG: DUF2384 domain-containing protein [Planctomycetes bacterium]|nr:DUF2384 domain-containing protein [Planctomycetota bacterium]